MFSASRGHSGIQRALCIVDPTLTGQGGHSLAYTLLLAGMATAFDLVEIFVDRKFRAERHANVHAALNVLRLHDLTARLGPVLASLRPSRPFQPVPLDFRFVAEDRWEPVKIPFLLVKWLRALDLSWSLYRLLGARYARVRDVHILFQNAGMEELFCLAILRRFFKARARPVTVHLLFRHAPARTCSRVAGIARLADLLKRQSALGYVRMYTDTEELSAAFRSIAPAPGQFQTLPVPLLIRKTSPPDRSDGTFRLGMLGAPRMEKGFGCLPTLLDILPAGVDGWRLELVVQTGAGVPDSEIRAVTAILRAHAKRVADTPDALQIRLLSGPVDAQTYAAWFAGLDCALNLSFSPKYAASSSGIFVEALHLGIPSIVFARTWMGKLISQAATEGLSIGLCVDSLGDVPAAVERIATTQAVFSDDIARYLTRHARRFDPKLLAATLFGHASGLPVGNSGAAPC